ncbi:MAG: S24/S26 family peptidase [Candidatus Methanomethylicia archaeon]
MKFDWRIPLIILIIFSMIQFTGRIIPMPINIVIYTGYSMNPTINHGDILISVSKDILRCNVGDIVLCYNGYMQYISHRIVEVHEDKIIMKGDNTENFDPPITINDIKYKVIMIIPRNIWITLTIIPVITMIIVKHKELIELLKVHDENITPIIFIISTLTIISITPINDTPIQSVISNPSVELRCIKVLNHNQVIVKYNVIHTQMKAVEKCIFKVANKTLTLEAYLNGSDTIIIETPIELYQLAYRNHLEEINFKLKVVFDRGCLEGEYKYIINWRKLNTTIINKVLLIENPNYIPINLSSIRIVYINLNEAGFTELIDIDELNPITINPEENYELKIEGKAQYAYIEFRYNLLGVEIIERKQIDFTR